MKKNGLQRSGGRRAEPSRPEQEPNDAEAYDLRRANPCSFRNGMKPMERL